MSSWKQCEMITEGKSDEYIFVYANVCGCCLHEVTKLVLSKNQKKNNGSFLEFVPDPKIADVFIFGGPVNEKRALVLNEVYSKISNPKKVIRVGNCIEYFEESNNKFIFNVDSVVGGCPFNVDELMEEIF